MAYVARSTDFYAHVASERRATTPKAAARPSFLNRLFSALIESRERETARTVEAYLSRTGYRFTDSIEREINDRTFNGGWNARR